MQLKGLVKFLTAALIVFSLWRLSFTFIANNVEAKIKAQADRMVSTSDPTAAGSEKEELLDKAYIHLTDSMRDEKVFGFLGNNYTYQEIKAKEMQLGLDLQGGMSVSLEVSLDGMIQSMSNSPNDPALIKALEEANKMRNQAPDNYVKLFGQAYEKLNPGGKLAYLFTKPSQTKITSASTNSEVLAVIDNEARGASERTYNVLMTRIDKFGVTQPSITLDQNKGIINVELAGVKNPESVRRQLQATAKLQFWEVYTNTEVAGSLFKANTALKGYLDAEHGLKKTDPTATLTTDSNVVAKATTDTNKVVADTKSDDLSSLLGKETKGTTAANPTGKASDNPLFDILMPYIENNQPLDVSVIGRIDPKNREKVLEYLNLDVVRNQFPSNVKFLVGENPYLTKAEQAQKNPPLAVYAIKTIPGTDEAKLEGEHVKSSRFDFQNNRAEISLEFDPQGTSIWAKLTRDNINRPIAIVLDNFVYSAPNVQNEIPNGRSSITGSFDVVSGTELANILQTGKLPAPAKIVSEQVVGPTLGAESVSGGVKSFAVSFIVIFILMIVYYNTGGLVANIALFLNLLFTFGVLSNLGFTVSMAGIAGIVLGIGMAVDSNVIIFERIKEELALGDSYEDAVEKGYKRSYAPVLDGHVTSLITAVILLIFGMGPIRGFATTQVVSLVISLFTGIMVSRLITDIYMRKGRHFKYFTSLSKSIFQKAHFHFMEKRKMFYGISAVLMLLGCASFFNGFDYGVEFDGGRSYTIKFDQTLKTSEVREKLHDHLGNKFPVVKTIGVSDQLNVTTDYLVHETGKEADDKVANILYNGLKAEKLIPSTVDYNTFINHYVKSVQTVSPTISSELKTGALKATLFSVLAIFIYIFVRFRKWQYSIGTIVSLLHDALITLAVFSFCRTIVPFSLEIDQHFIAALLTVIGFSMNDTVIVFDRVREKFRKDPNGNKIEIVNGAINDTLSRTIMTSLTVFLTAVILFIFGGEVLRGFAFAMSIGVVIGTYSSIFVAAPLLVDLDKGNTLGKEEDTEERIKALKNQA